MCIDKTGPLLIVAVALLQIGCHRHSGTVCDVTLDLVISSLLRDAVSNYVRENQDKLPSEWEELELVAHLKEQEQELRLVPPLSDQYAFLRHRPMIIQGPETCEIILVARHPVKHEQLKLEGRFIITATRAVVLAENGFLKTRLNAF